jgi:hypothetical protein
LPLNALNHTALWTGTKMLVWGGDGGSEVNTYLPGQVTWLKDAAATAPAARSGHSAVWTGKLMIVWGGLVGGSPVQSGGIYNPD